MEEDPLRFFRGMLYGSIAGVIAWALFLFMVVQLMDRI